MTQDSWKTLFPSEARALEGGMGYGQYLEPYRQMRPMQQQSMQEPSTRTLQPVVTGAGIVAAKFRDGVMVASDTIASYGSMQKYRGICRLQAVGPNTLVGASGDLSDFQQIKKYLDEVDTYDLTYRDGIRTSPKEFHSYLGRVMYNCRSKFDPLWNEVVVIGHRNGESFLGAVDLHGTVFQENFIANGMALHFAMPILRSRWRPDMSAEECKDMLETCMKVMFCRNTLSVPQIHIGTVTAAGPSISEPYEVATRWDYKAFERTPYNGSG